MTRAFRAVILSVVAIAQGCSPARAPAEVAQPAPTASPPQARGSSPPSEPASSTPGDAGAATGSAPAPDPLEEARQVMLQAAASDLKQPFPIEYPERLPSPYLEYAQRFNEHASRHDASIMLVVDSLRRMGAVGREALVTWVLNAAGHWPHRFQAYFVLKQEPQPGDLPAFLLLLGVPELRYDVPSAGGRNYGPLEKVIQLRARSGLHATLLVDISKIGTPEARAVLLKYANDRSLTEPEPKVLAALRCPPSGRSEVEARALASLRLWAVSLLDDPELWAQIADDRSEPQWFRRWMRRLIMGEPLVPRKQPSQWRRLDNQVSSPCLWVE